MNSIINNTIIQSSCYHCGEQCDDLVHADDKIFCCNGCKQVYLLLSENNLCSYYNLEENPGIKTKGKFISEKFAYLDDEAIIQKLVQFSSDSQTNVIFRLPQIHCSSCVFLLENLHKINEGIITSSSNFLRKEVFIVFDPHLISLRKVVELLAFIGYEPAISLNDTVKKKPVSFNRRQIYKIGVAGFCFSNIMMLSFPGYFSGGNIEQAGLKETFIWLNFALSIPVLFFSAADIFIAAWKGLRQKYLNIDAPIALAIIVTFARSYYEIISSQGAGYLDSGSGIVFFMLIGRWFQNKTYDSFSFDRDYRSYFPLGVTVIHDGVEKNIPVTQLEEGSRIILRNEEMIPADAILMRGLANIDYSFVSGENTPVEKATGELIYAGGKQMGSSIELQIIKAISQSYITQLWNNEIFNKGKNEEKSFIHPWSRYFTFALFTIAIGTGLYWWMNDPSKILPAVTAVLIVACPCSLLLSATFTYGNMLRIFGRNKLYLKNTSVIETLAKINTIVFDKTGTITQNKAAVVEYKGEFLSAMDKAIIKMATKQSAHPLSKMIAASIHDEPGQLFTVNQYKEFTGSGLEAVINNIPVKIGSGEFVPGVTGNISHDTGTSVHVELDNLYKGKFQVQHQYRDGISEMIKRLKQKGFDLHVLSGDNTMERHNLQKIFDNAAQINFQHSPQQKLDYIQSLQKNNKIVLMLGDGLNDAGALMQSDGGIAVSDNTTRFSPACDAILDGANVKLLDKFIAFAHSGKSIVTASFVLSVLYNVVGLSFAVQGMLSPMVAAILMPASSISIVLLVTASSTGSARLKGL
ncbi:MAG: heavy metal translocating P-type ATPase metal-binding domain-containing protein [Ginsengibacter sp.]